VEVPGNHVEDKPFVGDRMKVADDRKKVADDRKKASDRKMVLACHKMVADTASCVTSCTGSEEHKKAYEEQGSKTACDHMKKVVDNVESSGMA